MLVRWCTDPGFIIINNHLLKPILRVILKLYQIQKYLIIKLQVLFLYIMNRYILFFIYLMYARKKNNQTLINIHIINKLLDSLSDQIFVLIKAIHVQNEHIEYWLINIAIIMIFLTSSFAFHWKILDIHPILRSLFSFHLR